MRILLLVGVYGGLLTATVPAAEPTQRPNFVVFLVDDLGYADIGAYNPHTFYETPHVDQLARTGMRFTNGYTSCPVCSPTRYSLMTGKYPVRARTTNYFTGRRAEKFLPAEFANRMPLEEVTLAEALKDRGYQTAFLGKWHLGPTPAFWPENQGFMRNVGGHSAGSPPGGYFAPFKNPRMDNGPDGEHLPARLATEAEQILAQFHTKSFLLYLSFYSVHTPLQAPKPLVEKYRAKAERLGLTARTTFAEEEQIFLRNAPRRVRIVQSHPTYAAMIESMDRAVGRVLAKLEQLGITDNTVVVFTSDNGGLATSEGSPTANLPLRGGKGWMYEGGIRVPWIVRWPGVTAAGSVCDVPVMSTDVYPTLLAMASLPARPEQHQDGINLVPLLQGNQAQLTRPLFWHYPHYGNQGGFPASAVRLGAYKLIERLEDGQVHLYNLREDLGERQDRAEQMPAKVADLRHRLHTWRDALGAKYLRAKPNGPTPWQPTSNP